MKRFGLTITTLAAVAWGQLALAGPLDPDCTAEKAAKSATAKATVGVGGRCSPAEAAKDSAKGAVGIEEKGPIEKQRDDDTAVDATKNVVKKINQ
jgi:hypothetical protein